MEPREAEIRTLVESRLRSLTNAEARALVCWLDEARANEKLLRTRLRTCELELARLSAALERIDAHGCLNVFPGAGDDATCISVGLLYPCPGCIAREALAGRAGETVATHHPPNYPDGAMDEAGRAGNQEAE